MKRISTVLTVLILLGCSHNEKNYKAAITSLNSARLQDLENATFAGGCFWCTEAVFERVNGVYDVISGYTGGKQPNPTYKQVSNGLTDHAEAVQVFFDPQEITYSELVEIFFATHDPTTLNRQGPDIGKQYRSAVFYHNDQQKDVVDSHINELTAANVYSDPIVTEVQPYRIFYPAEDYHQDYYQNHPNHPYIIAVAKPKVLKFEKRFKDKLKGPS